VELKQAHLNFEKTVSLPAGQIVLQDWGRKDSPTIICLHGWLDNLASFYPLAEKLSENFHLLLIDLPGHGLADALPEGGHYYIWQNIELLHELLQQQELSKAHFLGHSMGGVIASLFAGTFSDQVESLILLDSLGPMVDSSFDAPKQLAKAILDGQRESSPLRIFPSTQDALNARKKSSPGMTEEALLPIVERNLGETAEGYSWSTDSRLRQASKVRLTEEQVEGFFREIHSPVQLIIAEQGIIPKAWLEKRKEYLVNAQRVEQVNIKGHHHFHAEQDGAENSALLIHDFIQNQ
jgi:pimeloyl-ACP methyl ester carboxylesterase|tara:strand:+ start:255 stop:1136 length:882 start_codon:yes stop_codon:yes gene_type:complete